jgi:response regulator of citrate/malate metabolism
MSTRSVPQERDDETGRFTTSWTNDDFLEALRELDGAAGTSEVADHVGSSRKTARRKLAGLAETGKVERQMIGSTLVWSLVNEDDR